MWVSLTVAFVALTAYITSRVCAQHARRARGKEERRRSEHRRELSALEARYLKEGFDDSNSSEIPEVALRSLGNVAYLIWLLNYEPKFRDYRGDGKNSYPPDWEWRRRFVFLRDHNACLGCGKHSGQGITLDCHHIKPISEFGTEESGIHSLNNLVSLCPICHAAQHLENQMLVGRASRLSSGSQHWSPPSGEHSNQEPRSNSAKRPFLRPGSIEVHPAHEAWLDRAAEPTFNSSKEPVKSHKAQVAMANPRAKSIANGLAWIDSRIAETKFQDLVRRCAEEDIYCNCDYCDKEILANPFQMSVKGKFLCDECYVATGGKE